MFRTMALLLAVTSVMACDPFRKAERQIDHPKGKVSNPDGVQGSVKTGSTQSSSKSVIDTTSDSLVLPFADIAPHTGLDQMLARPEYQNIPHAKMVANLTRLAMAHSKTPFNLKANVSDTIDVTAATAGACTGSIDFSLNTNLANNSLSGDVEVTMDFNTVACANGSVDGNVSFKAEFNVLTDFLKIVTIVQGSISDTVNTLNVDFAFRAEASLVGGLQVDMSVLVGEDSYTLNIDGDLSTGTATVTVEGNDGEITCDCSAGVATCTGSEPFDI